MFHDNGNEENVFDRFDYQIHHRGRLAPEFQFTRSWFQTPNSYDQQFHDINGVLHSIP